jgi:hypothetical protein
MGGSGAAAASAISAWSAGEVVTADDHQRLAIYFAQRADDGQIEHRVDPSEQVIGWHMPLQTEVVE